MLLTREFQVKSWEEAMRLRILSYWQDRGMVFHVMENDLLQGKRGSLWGNFTSFDMSKLIASLTIVLLSGNKIRCELDVNTTGQLITVANQAFFDRELDDFVELLAPGSSRLLRPADDGGDSLLRPVSPSADGDTDLLLRSGPLEADPR